MYLKTVFRGESNRLNDEGIDPLDFGEPSGRIKCHRLSCQRTKSGWRVNLPHGQIVVKTKREAIERAEDWLKTQEAIPDGWTADLKTAWSRADAGAMARIKRQSEKE